MMCPPSVLSALVASTLVGPAFSMVTIPDLYKQALKDDIKGELREYSPHEWALDSKCKELRLIGHGRPGRTAIQGVCVDDEGTRWLSELDLNRCFGNYLGKLVYKVIEPEPFDKSCSHCRLFHARSESDLLMACSCKDEKCEPQPAAAKLGGSESQFMYVRSLNGALSCQNSTGTKESAMGETLNMVGL